MSTSLPAAANGVDPVYDGGHCVSVQGHAVGIAEELIVPCGCPAPFDIFVHSVCLVPVVNERYDHLRAHMPI